MFVRDVQRDRTVAEQPLRAVHPVDAQLLLDQQRGRSRAIDEQFGFEALAALGQDRGNVAILGHFNLGDVIEIMIDAPRGCDLAQRIRKLERIHMIGIGQRLTGTLTAQWLRCEPELTNDRLCRRRLAKRDRAVAHQPAHRQAINGLQAKTVE